MLFFSRGAVGMMRKIAEQVVDEKAEMRKEFVKAQVREVLREKSIDERLHQAILDLFNWTHIKIEPADKKDENVSISLRNALEEILKYQGLKLVLEPTTLKVVAVDKED